MYRALAYVRRDIIRWSRAPMNVLSTLAMPCAWLLFMGLVMPVEWDGNYLDYVTPSILVMTVMTAGLSGGSSLMFDKMLGYLNKFLAMPAPRESILAGKIMFITIRGLLQATVILVISILIGATILSPLAYLEMYLILFMFGVFFSSLGTTVALYLGNHDSYAAFQSFVSMPLYFASTALVSYDMMPTWLFWIAKLNPLSYAIDATRAAAAGSFPLMEMSILLVLSVCMVLLCGRKFRKATMK
ncbi:MAG: ABC transporter permease [Candidatus Methanomethylophilaceae archaeon]|jgi:ABC-2 type transport system permease protein|nr:ABC transporter permease [Candidatus Methanomethylophilaceae archaeon]MBR7123351.1 ABC transporter permease [Candidatus Methanomethylophilaceae archaeon]